MEFAYISHLVGLIAIYAVLTMAFTVAMGRAGVVNFAHVALFGVGAYTSAILTTRFDVSWWIAFVAAVAAAGLVSAVLSVLLRRVILWRSLRS
jgi:branched-chain amino acid transport system permease protein